VQELRANSLLLSLSQSRFGVVIKFLRSNSWLIAGVIAFLIFLSTLQVTVNGSSHPYMTDVGEIQNALPRWGTIHFPGYPLYSFTGSAFVSAVRALGIEPSAGTSLLSAFWGAIAIAFLVILQQAFRVRSVIAISTSILFALSTSFWVDASIAEVHTLTMLLYFGSILFAVRFGRNGEKKDLLWLTFFASQAVLHQRAMVFMALGLFVLISSQLKNLLRLWYYVLGIVIAGSLIYLYLPIRDLQGAEWTFDQPGTWRGFWSLVLDTKTDRIISYPRSVDQWLERVRGVVSVLENELPLAVITVGLVGNLMGTLRQSKREAIGFFLLWFPFLVLSFVIWVGWIGDALLAVNLPVIAMSVFGLGLLTSIILDKSPVVGSLVTTVWILLGMMLFVQGRPEIVSITKDTSAEIIISQAEEFHGDGKGDPKTTLMALWGNDYWSLAYAQKFEDRLAELNLVDHNADLGSIMNSNGRLITPAQTFYLRPLSWWDQQFGQVYLSSESNNLVEINTSPPVDRSSVRPNYNFSLGNGVTIRRADLKWESANKLRLTVYWESQEKIDSDFSIAVHLVSNKEPDSSDDIIAQSDRSHPVAGWYPTSRWFPGEIVKDEYSIDIPAGSNPEAIRLGMYRQDVDGSFQNTEWLSILVDDRVDGFD
jgi:hypothetical protein